MQGRCEEVGLANPASLRLLLPPEGSLTHMDLIKKLLEKKDPFP